MSLSSTALRKFNANGPEHGAFSWTRNEGCTTDPSDLWARRAGVSAGSGRAVSGARPGVVGPAAAAASETVGEPGWWVADRVAARFHAVGHTAREARIAVGGGDEAVPVPVESCLTSLMVPISRNTGESRARGGGSAETRIARRRRGLKWRSTRGMCGVTSWRSDPAMVDACVTGSGCTSCVVPRGTIRDAYAFECVGRCLDPAHRTHRDAERWMSARTGPLSDDQGAAQSRERRWRRRDAEMTWHACADEVACATDRLLSRWRRGGRQEITGLRERYRAGIANCVMAA